MSAPWIGAIGALWLVVIVLGVLVLGLIRRISVALTAAESRLALLGEIGFGGLRPGEHVPEFRARTTDGDVVSRSCLVGDPSVLLFMSSGCPACDALVDELRADGFDPNVELVVVVDAGVSATPLNGVHCRVLLQEESQLSRAFEVVATPYAFAVDASGLVHGGSIVRTVTDVERLAATVKGGRVSVNATAALGR